MITARPSTIDLASRCHARRTSTLLQADQAGRDITIMKSEVDQGAAGCSDDPPGNQTSTIIRAACLEIEGLEPRRRQEPPMTDKAINRLRQRLIDDMAIWQLGPKTQHECIRRVKGCTDFVGYSADKARAEGAHRYLLRLASIGERVSTVNATACAPRFFVKVTPKRSDLADEDVSVREPRRLLAATTNSSTRRP
jgi:hypothetical protein